MQKGKIQIFICIFMFVLRSKSIDACQDKKDNTLKKKDIQIKKQDKIVN
jgi:hypothetical protein